MASPSGMRRRAPPAKTGALGSSKLSGSEMPMPVCFDSAEHQLGLLRPTGTGLD